METVQPKNATPQARADTAAPAADGNPTQSETGQAIYLRLMTKHLVGWDDSRAMLERALQEDHFLLFAQKILSLKPGTPDSLCYEVLLRLHEEEDNLLPAGAFFAIAESLGMMVEIDRWVARNVIAWGVTRLKNNPAAPLPMMCINLTAEALKSPAFVTFVREELNRSGFPRRALCFEINELDVIEHHKSIQDFIAAVKPGCRITLDAFGSGKVSFSHLEGLAIDFIKIDGVITQNILRDPAVLAKASAINATCQKIGVRVIAEFVESKETFIKLREIGVDYVQGFGIGRPEPIAKLA